MVGQTDARLVIDARAGDQASLDELVARYLPLVYNIVGRALAGHGDVDDVVQETMLRVVRGLDGLRDPGRFRSWLVAVAMNQVRDHSTRRGAAPASLDEAGEPADPGADFVDLTLTELGLSGQRREVALATRWLDADDRHLLSLWWLVTTGHLTRVELVAALEIDPHHVTVRVARMKGQLDVARMVVRALMAAPRCPGLADVAAQWRGEESPLWRKRFARHVRECAYCSEIATDLIPAERLLAGLSLVPLPVGYAAYMLAAAHSGHVGLEAAQAGHAASVPNAHAAEPSARIPEQRGSGGGRRGSHRPGPHGGHGGHPGHAGHGARAGHAGPLGPLTSKPVLAVLAITAAGGIGIAAMYAVESGKPSANPPLNSVIVSESAVTATPGVVSLPSASAASSASATPSASPTQSPSSSATPSASSASTSAKPSASATASAIPLQGATAAVQQVFALINQTRVQAGLPAYTISSGLTQSSTAHNQLMASGCGLSHQCPGEAGLGPRETAAGVQWTAAGENIGEGGPVADSSDAIAQLATNLTQSMINEQPPDDGHRRNILSTAFHHVGIAIYRDSNGTVWMTQDFSS